MEDSNILAQLPSCLCLKSCIIYIVSAAHCDNMDMLFYIQYIIDIHIIMAMLLLSAQTSTECGPSLGQNCAGRLKIRCQKISARRLGILIGAKISLWLATVQMHTARIGGGLLGYIFGAVHVMFIGTSVYAKIYGHYPRSSLRCFFHYYYYYYSMRYENRTWPGSFACGYFRKYSFYNSW